MHGTWKVTGTAGSGAALAVASAVAAFEGVAWVLAHVLWILGTGVLCAALTGVAVARLMRWSDERAARVWAQRPAHLRAEAVAQVPAREVPAVLPPAGAPAIGPVYIINLYGPAGDTHAALIRKAITGTSGLPSSAPAIERNDP